MKTDNNIEHILTNEPKLMLSTDEKASIKSVLLMQAKEGLRHESQRPVSLWTTWVIRGSVSFASLMLVFVSTAYAAQGSLPGEPLYAVKVHVVEEMIALTKITPEERVAYDSKLMEVRFNELKTLADQEATPAPEDIVLVADQIDEHVTDMTNTIQTTDTAELPHEKKIESLSKIAALAKAQSKVTENEEGFSKIKETTDHIDETTSDAISSTVKDFTREKPAEEVSDYLSTRMQMVSDRVTATTTGERTRDSVEGSLHNVDEALVDGSVEDAIVSITEAQQTIMTDEYLGADSMHDQEGKRDNAKQ